jgi:hypothetical protein
MLVKAVIETPGPRARLHFLRLSENATEAEAGNQVVTGGCVPMNPRRGV